MDGLNGNNQDTNSNRELIYRPDYNSIPSYSELSGANNVFANEDIENLSQYKSTNNTSRFISPNRSLQEEEFLDFFNYIHNTEHENLKKEKDKLKQELIKCQVFIQTFDLNYEFYLDRLRDLDKIIHSL